MATIENSLKHEAEVEPCKIRLITSGEFVRAYNHSAWLFYCCISKYNGVEFLGAYAKPYRTYPSTRSLRRIRGRMRSIDWTERPRRIQARVNSMLGVLSHYDCYQVRKVLAHRAGLRGFGKVTDDCLKFHPDVLNFQKYQTKMRGTR